MQRWASPTRYNAPAYYSEYNERFDLMNVLKKPLIKWFLIKKRHNVYPGSLKQNWTFRFSKDKGRNMEKTTITFFSSSMALKIYGDRVSVGCSEKFLILRNLLQHALCKLFSFRFVIWLKFLNHLNFVSIQS